MKKKFPRQNEHVHSYFSLRARDNTYRSLYTREKDNRESYNYKLRKKIILAYLIKIYSGSRAKILDAGCGTGEQAREIRQIGFEYTGFDFSWPMVSLAGEYHFPVFQADARCIPILNNSREIVMCLGVAEYITEREKVFREFNRILGEKGLLIFSVSTRFCFENWVKALLFLPRRFISFFYYLLTQKEPYRIKHLLMSKLYIKRLLKKTGFTVRERIYYNPNLLCFPMSRLWPQGSMKLSKKLETRANNFPIRFFTTAVIVVAEKEQSLST